MALVEVIGLYLANQEAFLNRLKTDMAAAGWTKVDENTKSGSCSFSTVDTTANTFTINNHGFSDGELFQFYTSGTAPSPLTNWNPYYIRDATQNTFKLCSTQGGSAIDLTPKGPGPTISGSTCTPGRAPGRTRIKGSVTSNSFAPRRPVSMFTAVMPSMPPPIWRLGRTRPAPLRPRNPGCTTTSGETRIL